MKKRLLYVFIFLGTITVAQEKEKAEELVLSGIELHDKGDYKGAIEVYDKALALDKDNFFALAEKAMTLNNLGRYEESIEVCKKAIEKHPTEKELKNVYVAYGNALDALKLPEQSITLYNDGIALFPDFYLLHFNQGITYSTMNKMVDAEECFKVSASLNPNHASSHNALATISKINKKNVASFLAYSRFLIVEPEGTRAAQNLERLKTLLYGNMEKTGKNSYTINIDSSFLGDTTADGKNKEDNFSSTELIMALSGAVTSDNKKQKLTEVERFMKSAETIISSLEETKEKNSGFYWEYYVPYFIQLKNEKFLETFAYVAFASSGDKKVVNWIKEHGEDIQKFYKWSSNYEWTGLRK